MFKERRQAAVAVATNLFAVEDALDATVKQTAQLTSTMLTARTDAKLSALYGQDALGHLADANALMIQARGKVIEAHKALDETRAQLGLSPKAAGDIFEKPPITKPEGGDATPLRVVSEAA